MNDKWQLSDQSTNKIKWTTMLKPHQWLWLPSTLGAAIIAQIVLFYIVNK